MCSPAFIKQRQRQQRGTCVCSPAASQKQPNPLASGGLQHSLPYLDPAEEAEISPQTLAWGCIGVGCVATVGACGKEEGERRADTIVERGS